MNSATSVLVVTPGCPAELIQELLGARLLPSHADVAVLLPPGDSRPYDHLIENRDSGRKVHFVSSPGRRFFSPRRLRWLKHHLWPVQNTYLLITQSPYSHPPTALIALSVLALSGKTITLLFATPEAVIDMSGRSFSERWIVQDLNAKILVRESYRIFWFLNPWNILYFFMFGGMVLRQMLAERRFLPPKKIAASKRFERKFPGEGSGSPKG